MRAYVRNKDLKCLFLLISVSYGWYILLFNGNIRIFRFQNAFNIYNNDLNFQIFKALEDKFTIETYGCTIPALKLNGESLEKLNFSSYLNNLTKCVVNSPSLDNNRTHIWIVRSDDRGRTNDVCCYKSFYRSNMIEDITSTSAYHRLKYRKCIVFNEAIRVRSKDEFVRVKCKFQGKAVYKKFFLFAPKKKFMSTTEDTTETYTSKSAYNVIVMGLNAISRLNFHRTMPKTLEYLQEIGAIELLGYHKIENSTRSNIYPLLMGEDLEYLKKTCLPHFTTCFDNCPFIWEWFKKAGYYTALAEDISSLSLFNYKKHGFLKTPTDYYTYTFTHEAEKYGNGKIKQRFLCSQDKYFYEILLDYVENLTMTLKTSKLFGVFWESSISHDELNNPMIMDDRYASFLETLLVSNYLDNTIMFLISDQGMRSLQILATKQGRIESKLPFVYILVPPSFRQEYSKAYDNLKLNSLRLTTPYDMYVTLLDLADMKNLRNERIAYRSHQYYSKDRGISLFLEIPANRTCNMAGIGDSWCTCHKSKPLSVNGEEARQASLVLEEYISSLLESQPQCARLTVTEVLQVKELLIPFGSKNDVEWREFIIAVVMWPGGGKFEATLRYDDVHSWSVVGTVNRINAYSNQSYCTPHFYLKLYCYCD